MKFYKLIGSHPEDTAEGAVLAPGETTESLAGFDADDPFNYRLIEEGKLIEVDGQQEINATDGAIELAEEKNVALGALTGTGANGRITKEDVERHLADTSGEE